MSDSKTIDEMNTNELILAYVDEFNDAIWPPLFSSEEELRDKIKKAFETGKPIEYPDVPEDALI